jgi:hypothetical protein
MPRDQLRTSRKDDISNGLSAQARGMLADLVELMRHNNNGNKKQVTAKALEMMNSITDLQGYYAILKEQGADAMIDALRDSGLLSDTALLGDGE